MNNGQYDLGSDGILAIAQAAAIGFMMGQTSKECEMNKKIAADNDLWKKFFGTDKDDEEGS